MKISPPFFTCGPFASASFGADDFSSNLYFSYLFQDSLQKQNELKEELNVLPETSEKDILHKKSQLEYLEAIFNLQLSIAGDHEVESWLKFIFTAFLIKRVFFRECILLLNRLIEMRLNYVTVGAHLC